MKPEASMSTSACSAVTPAEGKRENDILAVVSHERPRCDIAPVVFVPKMTALLTSPVAGGWKVWMILVLVLDEA